MDSHPNEMLHEHIETDILCEVVPTLAMIVNFIRKSHTSTVALLAVREDGLTLTLIFLSLESPGLHTKNLGMGNLSCIMYYRRRLEE